MWILHVLFQDGLWSKHSQIHQQGTEDTQILTTELYKCPEKIKQQAYTSIVRPIVQYFCLAWDPYCQKHISFLKGNYQHKASVTQMLQSWASLEDRRLVARMSFQSPYERNSSLSLGIKDRSPEVKDQTSMSTFLPEHAEQKYTRRASFLGPSVNGIKLIPANIITDSTSDKSFNLRVWSYMQSDHSAQLYTGRPERRFPAMVYMRIFSCDGLRHFVMSRKSGRVYQ